jgi:hypothetical protein
MNLTQLTYRGLSLCLAVTLSFGLSLGGCPSSVDGTNPSKTPDDVLRAIGASEPSDSDTTPTTSSDTDGGIVVPVGSYGGDSTTPVPVNTPPTVPDVTALVEPGTAVTIALQGQSPAQLALTYEIVAAPAVGTLYAIEYADDGSASVLFVAPANFAGQAQFSYRATDGVRYSNVGTVLILAYSPVVFDLSVCRGSAPLTVTARAFTMSGVPLPDGEYHWDWGDGQEGGPMATFARRTHTYVRPGVYSVTLTLVFAGISGPLGCSYAPAGGEVAARGTVTVEPVISGQVRDAAGAPLVGVSVSSSDGRVTTSGQDGRYSLQVAVNWSGTIAPVGGSRLFGPGSRTYVELHDNLANQDFQEQPPNTVSVSGFVRDASSVGVPNVSLAVTGLASPAVSDASGFYLFSVPMGWSGTVTPTLSGYTLNPPNRAYASLTANRDNEGYTATVVSTAAPGTLSVSPVSGLASSGPVGGPFTPVSQAYTLTNVGGQSLSWTLAKSQAWVTLSKSSGTLAGGASDTVTVSIGASAASLAADAYADTLVFTNATNHLGDAARVVSLVVVPAGTFAVVPGSDFTSTGNQGGPFDVESVVYTLTNTTTQPVNWSAANTQGWLTLSKAGGTVAAGASDTVTARLTGSASGLAVGNYSDVITFTNLSTGQGDTTRGVHLTVTAPALRAVLYTPPETMRIAPYTALFSGLDSTAAGGDRIVRWDWDFGDALSADPATDEGLVVAHCFDNAGTYTVRLTITTAAGQSTTTTINLSVAVFSGYTYYVDATLGSDSWTETEARNNINRPWKTLAKAFTAAVKSQNNPCKVLLKRGETWTLSDRVYPPNPSIVGAYGSAAEPPTVICAETNGLFYWGGSSNTQFGYGVTLEDLKITAPTNERGGLVGAHRRGTVIRRCILENGGISATMYGRGFVLEDTTIHHAAACGLFAGTEDADTQGDMVLRRNTIHHCGKNSLLDHGIYLSGSYHYNTAFGRPTARNLLIENNTLYSNANLGMNIRAHDGCVIRHNLTYGDGNEEYFATQSKHGNGNGAFLTHLWRCVYENNETIGLDGPQTQGWALFVRTCGDWLVIRNNLLCNVKNGVALQGGYLDSQDYGDIRFYHNVLTRGITITKESATHILAAGKTAKFHNNVITTTASTAKCVLDDYDNQLSAAWAFDYNRYYSPNNTASPLAGASFATWQSAGWDPHTTVGDPALDANWVPTAGSPCRHTAVPLPEAFRDHAGAARDGMPDIGAFETP